MVITLISTFDTNNNFNNSGILYNFMNTGMYVAQLELQNIPGHTGTGIIYMEQSGRSFFNII